MTTSALADAVERARAWLEANASRRSSTERREFTVSEAKELQRRLHEQGLVGLTYPAEYGGRGLSQSDARPIEELVQEYELPFEHFAIGLGMCGPIVLSVGTEEQKHRHIGPLLEGEEIWCQLFSEPEAGSDVAALRTRAVKTSEGWRINGQKVWSSGAHYSDFGILLARTDPDVPKHRGITMFILDMKSPGVTVRPLQQITGRSRFNEVFLDDVLIKDADVLGELNEGWLAALRTLSFERASVASWSWNRSLALSPDYLLGRAEELGVPLSQADLRNLARLYASESVLEGLVRFHKAQADAGRSTPAVGSITKLAETMHKDLCAEVACMVSVADLVCEDPAADRPGRLLTDLLGTRGSSIAGGTDEIQRTIIGERLLELPSEPRVDKALPFRDLPTGESSAGASSSRS